ncbi:MAG: small subunit ribosomal protein S27e [Actinomycetota bacterium]
MTLLIRQAHWMFDCPRCGGKNVEARFYGPCDKCRDALNEAAYKAPTERAAADAYVPKMNVTPNAVALKED